MRRSERQRQLPALFCLSLLLVQSLAPVSAQVTRRPAAQSPNSRPSVKLVVGIVIDQFRADYLDRFADQFTTGGLRLLLDKGSVFANAHYLHTPTYTACGHATFMSGSTPSMNGIIGNEWFERETGKRVTSVSDAGVKLLGGKDDTGGASPIKLMGTTLGDEMRFATQGQAKVVGVSFKDRSAILPAGKRPNGAYWFNATVGAFVSSTYYFNEMPAWAQKFNRESRPDRYFGKKWERLLPAEAYSRSQPDNSPYEKSAYGNTFPYTINGGEAQPGPKFYSQFEATPFGNEFLVDFAKAAVEGEGLGADDVADLLTVSFSANDLLGHTYGPYSQEVQDMTLRTDRVLADFFTYLDKKIGLEHVVIALSADHGVAPVPEQARAMGYGGRIEGRTTTAAIETALNAKFGEEKDGKWVKQFVNSNIYLDDAVIDRRKADRGEIEKAICAAALKVPGIGTCFTRTDLVSGKLQTTKIATSVARGFHPARNGEVILVPQPYFFFSEGLGTTHGTPYNYDTHVPVILFGAGIAAGRQLRDASPLDIAPTLAALLHLTPPSNCEGHILTEAFTTRR
jgi:predicted AlkP superfamily pyrophosphatase or phosphodiesterase